MGRPRARGRGRPSSSAIPSPEAGVGPSTPSTPTPTKTKSGPGRPVTPGGMLPPSKIRCLKFPVTDRDDQLVQCSLCSEQLTFRAFRLHNIEKHYNLGTTTDDQTLVDHKFYEKKLKEMAKLTQITIFRCPRAPCISSYKSALGLGYHLETCGKTKEEIELCLLECPECHLKFTLPNLAWHRKTHTKKKESPGTQSQTDKYISKRKSEKARGVLKEYILPDDGDGEEDQEPKHPSRQLDPDILDNDYEAVTKRKANKPKRKSSPKKKAEDGAGTSFGEDEAISPPADAFVYHPSTPYILGTYDSHLKSQIASKKPLPQCFSASQFGRPSMDIATQVVKYLETQADIVTTCAWDNIPRVVLDPFESILHSNSITPPKSSKQCRQFLPEMESSVPFRTKVQLSSQLPKNTKKLLARKTQFLTTDFHRIKWFTSEVITGDTFGTEDLNKWVIFTGGAVTSLAWHPNGKYLAISTLKNHSENPNLIDKSSHSSSVQIYSLGKVQDVFEFNIEIVYGLEDTGYANHLQWGNYRPLDSNEETLGYLAGAFEDSTCRIIRVKQGDFTSKCNFGSGNNQRIRVYKKIPEICLTVGEESIELGQCLVFDWHEGNRFLATGYSKGQVAIFDLQTTSKLLKRTDTQSSGPGTTVTYFTPFWIITSHCGPVRGVVIDPQFPRYVYTGSMDKTLRTWDIELRTEIECKRLGCIVDLTWIRGWTHLAVTLEAAMSNQSSHFMFQRFCQLGKTKGDPNVMEYFNITSSSFFEGMLLTGLEQGRLTTSYYDSFWRDCDLDRNKKKQNVVLLSSIELDEDSFVPGNEAERPEDIVPFSPDEEPRITIILTNLRTHSTAQQEPSAQFIENFYRFYKFLRINKVSWSPGGNYMAIGYRNGLVTILPGTFDKIYPKYYW